MQRDVIARLWYHNSLFVVNKVVKDPINNICIFPVYATIVNNRHEHIRVGTIFNRLDGFTAIEHNDESTRYERNTLLAALSVLVDLFVSASHG